MEELMEAIVERCAGLDVHQATVVACLNLGTVGAKPSKQLRTFGTTLPDLEELRDWLKANDCTLVAMESTGVYWKPVYAVLEDHFEMVVGNPSAGIPAASRPEPWPPSPTTSRTCPAARPT
jgi:hypothetical protein